MKDRFIINDNQGEYIMATRSIIGVMHGDNCKAVYCHWDGYLANNGRILNDHFDSAKANELVSLGSLSSLGRDIGEKHSFDNPFEYGTDDYKAHRKMYDNMCTFYFRDRGETFDGETFKTFTSHNDLFEYAESSWCEFIYIMKDGVWYVDQMEGAGLEILADALNEITQ